MVEAIEKLIGSSYMLGLIHAEEENPERKINAADETEIPAVPFTEAIQFLKSKVPMSKTEWNKLEPKLRFRAFTVAKLGEAEIVNKAKQILVSALEKGGSYSSTWEELKKKVNVDTFGIKPGYWENVFRTNTQSAYIAGKLQQYENTGVAAYQLMVIEDSRTSKICRHLLTESGYGMILPVGHPFWKKYGFPPYHFQCRTSIRAIWPSQIGKLGNNVENPSMKSLTKFKVQDGFGGNPLERGSWWEMTDSMKKLAEKFGVMDEIEAERKILGISGRSKSSDFKTIKMDINDITIVKVEDEIAGVKKGSPMSFADADNGNANPNYVANTETAHNCPACILSMKARMDGFNIIAKPYDKTNPIMDILSENTQLGFIDKDTGFFPEYLTPKKGYMPMLLSWFDTTLENNKFYSIEFFWKDFTPDGHIMMIFKKEGHLMLYDPQTNERWVHKNVEKFLYTVRLRTIKLMNISDCFLNKSVVDYVLEVKK